MPPPGYAVDNSEIAVHLGNLKEAVARIETQNLSRIETQVRETNGRTAKLEQWQSATDMVLESMNERISNAEQEREEFQRSCMEMLQAHQTYQDEQRGGNVAKAQMYAIFVGAASGVIAVIKLVFFHS